jgi:SAM-dependent methyltransferase
MTLRAANRSTRRAPTPVGWDDRRTVAYYEAFCERHDRYRRANEVLLDHARLAPGQRVLDVGAGTGRTAESALPRLGGEGTILCVEPARAMRERGMKRIRDARLSWSDACPSVAGSFDRIVCGAAFWQLLPLPTTIRRLTRLLAPAGALVFNVPGLYLGIPDEPGGGRDPLLLELPGLLVGPASTPLMPSGEPLPDPAALEAMLTDAGLYPEPWSFQHRLMQEAHRDWLKIPVLTDHWLAGASPRSRADRIDAAFLQVDASSWRWERWLGWTAWAPP